MDTPFAAPAFITLCLYVIFSFLALRKIWLHPVDDVRTWQWIWTFFCLCFPVVGSVFFLALVDMPPLLHDDMRYRETIASTSKSVYPTAGIPFLYKAITGTEIPTGPAEKGESTISLMRDQAKGGDPEAQCAYGLFNAAGVGVRHDPEAAVYWFRKSAEHGFPPAQAELGAAYYEGAGVGWDAEEAYFWLLLASKSDYPRYARLRVKLEETLTTQQLMTLRARARDWKPNRRSFSAEAKPS